MTRFGKGLLLFNLAFSLLLAAWAFNLYANGIDWSDHKGGTPPVPVGQYAIREVRLEELWKGVPPAQANWLTERRKLLEEESRLVADRTWYDEEMKHVFVTATAAKPLGEIVVAVKDDDKAGVKKGQVILDEKGYPLLKPLSDRGKNPLQALAVYQKQHEEILKSLKEVLDKQQLQIDEAIQLTDLIIGDKAKGVRGLQQRILDEKAKNANLLVEQKSVKPLLINTVVELELIAKRREQLKKRIEELEKINVASK